MKRINDDDFRIIKENLPKCSNVLKPTKKHILETYDNMNEELDKLTFGRIDIVHPKEMEEYRKERKERWQQWVNAIGDIFDSRYYVKGRR
jgi:hypothetical protein